MLKFINSQIEVMREIARIPKQKETEIIKGKRKETNKLKVEN